jgi:hypothetical protein
LAARRFQFPLAAFASVSAGTELAPAVDDNEAPRAAGRGLDALLSVEQSSRISREIEGNRHDRSHDLLRPPSQKISGSIDQISLQTTAFVSAVSRG